MFLFTMPEQIEYVIDSSKKKFFDWKELWQYRELFYFFTWRDVKVKYKQTTIGVLWVLIQPLLSVAIFSFFLSRALKIQTPIPYPIFVFSGLILWNVFASAINAAGNSMISNAPIIKKIFFPRIIIPVSALLVCFVDFVVAFIAFLGMAVYYQLEVEWLLLLLLWPSAILITFIGTLGISCWLASLTLKYRDFRYVIPFGLQIALFVSPVMYPVADLGKQWLSVIIALNPMYAAITLFRIPLGISTIEPMLLTISLVSTLLFLAYGIYYFKKTEDFFADLA